MFESSKSSKDDFIKQTKAARHERAHEKDKDAAARCIQKTIRNWLNRKNFTKTTLQDFDSTFSENSFTSEVNNLRPAIEKFQLIIKFISVYKKERDKERMEKLCRYLVQSLNLDSMAISYVGVALSKDRSICWIALTKKILRHCLHELKDLHPEQPFDSKSILLRLHTLVSFTSTSTWAIMKLSEMEKLKTGMNHLCSNIIGDLVNNNLYNTMQILLMNGLGKGNTFLQPTMLLAITTLTIRPLIYSQMSIKVLQEYLINIFSVPTLIHHLNQKANSQCIQLLKQHHLFSHIIKYLSLKENLKTLVNALNGNSTLCLLANLTELADLEYSASKDIYYPGFTSIVINLLEFCQQYVTVKKSSSTCWHPILGWFEYSGDRFSEELTSIIKKQLSYLWTGNIITEIMCEPLEKLSQKYVVELNSHSNTSNINAICRKFLDLRSSKNNFKINNKLKDQDVQKIFDVCSLYYFILRTLRELKSVILTGLCYKDKNILHNLWLFLASLGPNNGLKIFLDNLSSSNSSEDKIFQMLILFCDCMTHFITILDDIEMYESQDPFKLSDYVSISYFLNQFLYKSISSNIFDTATIMQEPLFISVHTLLMAIYRRDCQKPFCAEEHWLIKEIRLSSFLTDLEKGKRGSHILLSKMPHILPHSERVIMFRKYIKDEKVSLGLSDASYTNGSTLILIRRWRIVEDGYRQLAMLPPQALKNVIRVRFVNEQGLDEAGIDQDGVFKEFLEETISRVFDPSLNLFKVTSENRLYPSSTSSIQENHLLLFEFIGRMLGKAVYEGIVVDVPFASFFVSQFCGQTSGVLYSCLDELASLDQELYRSLTIVKHYTGDIRDLELTFSLNEEVMGKIVTYELKPGGKVLPVTNENKITYIHMMAQFRMYVQIKEQITAFTKGFRSIIKSEWLSLFSTPEWQRLISGENTPLNLQDLRKNTQYYGGFHDKHRVISWLWDILQNDFSETERGLFLKFVTSCSKSPLLGFAYLEPPFSIRCIEVGDDEDTGDTIGSVIRGFFTIRKKDPQYRLPTSSTCFNLLKLPNYRKKSILKEKLRYAITSRTGFELS